MNSTQPYLPLSQALNPSPSTSGQYASQSTSATTNDGTGGFHIRQPDEDDGDDEGTIAQQLNEDEREDDAIQQVTSANASQLDPNQTPGDQPPKKRGPGRPKGSKTNRNKTTAQQATASAGITNPSSRFQVTPENQAYYEFQWRILNLCAEFYGAAEELVRSTSPTVIAQCYQMAGTSPVDPLGILSDAKRVVDTLMANPSQLLTRPPPSNHHSTSASTVPSYFPFPQNPTPTTSASLVSGPAASASASAVAAAVASIQGTQFQPPSTSQQSYGQSQSTVQSGQSLFSATTFNHYRPPHQVQGASVAYQLGQNSAQALGAKEGHWSEEEEAKLKQLVEENRSDGEPDWDKVVKGFEGRRTRHQILIKATSMGFKESSTKSGSKRKREPTAQPPMNSPAQPVATPPQQQPQTQYPMPVIATGGAGYYRPRPNSTTPSGAGNGVQSEGSSTPRQSTAHPFMFQPE